MKVSLKFKKDEMDLWAFETYTSEKENDSGESTKYDVLCSESDYIYESKEEAIKEGIAAIKTDGDTLVGYYKRFDK